jgi:hypothetical protein
MSHSLRVYIENITRENELTKIKIYHLDNDTSNNRRFKKSGSSQ